MSCSYKCTHCGKKFDKFSGQLINLSDFALKWYYALPLVQKLLKCHKHVILCADCIEHEHGSLRIEDYKLKSSHHMTSNLCYMALKQNHPEWIEKIKRADDKGVSKLKVTLLPKGEMVA